MAAAALATTRVTISDSTVHEARATSVPRNATLSLRDAAGAEIPLPREIQAMLLKALATVADQGEVTIGRLPDSLTSTAAADVLGVSRPTLIKWAREGQIASFTVGTHTRFKRDEVLRARSELMKKRRAAFDALRAFDAEGAT